MSPRRKGTGAKNLSGETGNQTASGPAAEPTVLSKIFTIELARMEIGTQIEAQCTKVMQSLNNWAADHGYKVSEIKMLATKADTSMCLFSTAGEEPVCEVRIGWENKMIRRFDMFFSMVMFGPNPEDLEDKARSIIAYELNATF